MMKTLLAKALMFPLTRIPGPLENMQVICREVQLIYCKIQQHNACLVCIKGRILCIIALLCRLVDIRGYKDNYIYLVARKT